MTDSKSRLDERAAPFCAPCSTNPPSGADVRYDPQFEALQKEVGKLEDPGAGAPDWALVEREATQITAQKSKDVLVLAWLSMAMYERHGIDGLATGLWALTTLVDTQWDGLFPAVSRIKGRASAVTWLVTRAVLKLEATSALPSHDDLDALLASIKRAQSIMPERFGEYAPGLRPLSDAAERVRLSMPARPAAAAPSAPAPTAPAPSAPTPAAPTPAAPTPAAPTPAATPAPAAPATAAPSAPESSRVDVLEARIAPFLAPVAGAQPAGDDLRYDPEHEWLRSEVAKLENPGGGLPDWKEVERRATTVLEKRSKDILVGSYLAWALAERDGVEGLATGLLLLGGVMGAFWEGLHPLRPKARTAALTWLLTRIDQALAQPTPMKGSADREVVSRLELAARVFVSMVRDKFVEDPPSTRPLLDNVERLKMSLPAPKPAAPPPPPAAAAAPAPTAVAAAPVAPIAVATPAAPTLAAGADVTPFLQQTSTALIAAASALRGASIADPVAYRVHRTALYLAVAATPPTTQAPKTGMRPPTPALRTQLQTLAGNGKWDALLAEAEGALGMNRFWLDLHRYVVQALTQLGHKAAADAVTAETSHLARRFPTLATLQFSDGSATASADTAEWLQSIAGSGEASGGGGEADGVSDAIAEAKALASSGKRDEALKALQAAVSTAPDDRSRFRLRLGLARICAQGSVPAARGLLDGLCREIEALHLDAWDPALAAEALRAYHELLRDAAKANPRVAEEAAEVYRRLCRIDVSLAIAAGG